MVELWGVIKSTHAGAVKKEVDSQALRRAHHLNMFIDLRASWRRIDEQAGGCGAANFFFFFPSPSSSLRLIASRALIAANPAARLRYFDPCGKRCSSRTDNAIKSALFPHGTRFGKRLESNWKQFAASRAIIGKCDKLMSSFVCSFKVAAHVRSAVDAPNSARSAAAMLTTAFLFLLLPQPTFSSIKRDYRMGALVAGVYSRARTTQTQQSSRPPGSLPRGAGKCTWWSQRRRPTEAACVF